MSFFSDVKADLFTPKGILVTLIHVAVVVGILAIWLFVNVQVLGNTVALSVPSSQSFKSK